MLTGAYGKNTNSESQRQRNKSRRAHWAKVMAAKKSTAQCLRMKLTVVGSRKAQASEG